MAIAPLPEVTVTPVAYFPQKYFLENLVVRADGSLLITAILGALLAADFFARLITLHIAHHALSDPMAIIIRIVGWTVAVGLLALLFALIYKVVPDVKIGWRDVWYGAAVTALLFTIGKALIGIYLGKAGVGSPYGAAGSLVVLVVWVYYSAQILFLGAEFTQVYARRFGTRIVPSDNAVSTRPSQAGGGATPPPRAPAPSAARST